MDYLLKRTKFDKGNEIVATDFSGRKLGYYDKGRNVTCDFSHRILARGDITSALIMNAQQ